MTRELSEALHELEERYRTLFEHIPIGVLLYDRALRVTACNQRFAEIIQSSQERIIGFDLRQLNDQSVMPAIEGALEGKNGFYEGGYEATTGPARIWITLSVSPLRDGRGTIAGGMAIVENISERRLMQAKLLQADRMASLGTLVAGVAHEINNPLAYLIGHLNIICEREFPHLMQQVQSIAELHADALDTLHQTLRRLADMIDVVQDGAERVQRIVADLKTFSRAEEDMDPSAAKHRIVEGPVDIQPVLDASINLAYNEVRHRAQLVREDGETPPVMASSSRLGQLFLNLLLNAAQALPPGNVAGNSITIRTRTDASGHAVVEISDTGHGIPEDLIHRIFDPFFTTKPVGEGTGLGLWICQSIVRSLGGDITVKSRPGATIFRVVLPASAAVPEPTLKPSRPPTKPASRRHRVLVVDDEPLLARVIATHLSDEHDVVVVHSGREALERLRDDADFDAILCDLMMPDSTGRDVYDELSRNQPLLCRRILFMTGGAFTPMMREFLDSVPNPQLDKPFTADELCEEVWRTIRKQHEAC